MQMENTSSHRKWRLQLPVEVLDEISLAIVQILAL